MLNNAANQVYFRREFGGFTFGPYNGEPFEESVPISEDSIEITYFDSNTIITKKEFFAICCDFAVKALDFANEFNILETGVVQENWLTEIKTAANKLELLNEN